MTGRLLNHDTFTVQLLDCEEQLRSFAKADLREHGFAPRRCRRIATRSSRRRSPTSSAISSRCKRQARLDERTRTQRCSLVVGARGASRRSQAQVTFDRILNAEREPQNWLSYSGDARQPALQPARRRSRRRTSKNLELQWVWQARSLEKFEATALVVDGVLYTVQAPNDVVALDAATGRLFWTYHLRARAGGAHLLRPREPRPRDPRRHACSWARSTRTCSRSTPRAAQLLWDATVASAAAALLDHDAPIVVKDKVHRRHRAAATWASAATSPRSTRRPARRCGASTRFPGPASPATTRGPATRGRPAAPPSGTPAPTIPETNLAFFGTGNPGARLGRPRAARRQPVQRQRRRARRRHRQAEVALPVHAARRARLRLDAGARARRHRVARHAAQGDALGESQRPDVRARPRHAASSCSASRT